MCVRSGCDSGHQLARGAVCIILGIFERQGGNSAAQASERALTNKYLAWKECACKRAATASLVACVCSGGVIFGHQLVGDAVCIILDTSSAARGEQRSAGIRTGPHQQQSGLARMCMRESGYCVARCLCVRRGCDFWPSAGRGRCHHHSGYFFSGKGGTAQRRHPDGAPPTTIWLGKNVHARERLLRRSLLVCATRV